MPGWWIASYIVLWVLVVVLCAVVVALARQVGTLYLRLGPRGALEVDEEGPALGEAPEPVEASTTDGRPITVGGPGEAQLVMFVSPGCHLCEQVIPALPAVARSAGLAPLMITDVDAQETALVFGDGHKVPVVAGANVAPRYQIPGTPYLVVLDDLGVVRAKGTANNLEQMEGLVETATRRIAGERDAHERQAS